MLKRLLILICIGLASVAKAQDVFLSGVKPGKAVISSNKGVLILKNDCLSVKWLSSKNSITIGEFAVRGNKGISLKGVPVFELELKDGTVINSADFQLSTSPKIVQIKGDLKAAKLSEKENGVEILAEFLNAKYGIRVRWEAILKDNANYIRQVLAFIVLKIL
jgi:hypothetical protein